MFYFIDFHFPKKYVALTMFLWFNISLSYWKLFWINDLKCLLQLFVFNKLHVFLNKIVIIFSRFIWYFHILSIIIPFWFWNLIQLNLIAILIWVFIEKQFLTKKYMQETNINSIFDIPSQKYLFVFLTIRAWMREERSFNFWNFLYINI